MIQSCAKLGKMILLIPFCVPTFKQTKPFGECELIFFIGHRFIRQRSLRLSGLKSQSAINVAI